MYSNDQDKLLWYTRIRGETRGPFDLEQLKVLAARGRLGRFHEVSTDMESWKPAGSLPELFAAPVATTSRNITPEEETGEPDLVSLTDAAPSRAEADAISPPQEQWFYYQNGVQQGPAPRGVLLQLLASGTLKRNDSVWRPDWDDWKTIQDAPEFRDADTPTRSKTTSHRMPRDSSSEANSGIAAVLSLVIPGAGQMYKGNVGAGFAWLLGTAIGYACFIFPGLIAHILCVVDAASSRRR